MKKIFEKDHLTYDWEEHNEVSFNISFPVSQQFLDRNATMYLHVEYEADYRFKDQHTDLDMPEHKSIPGYSNAWFKDEGNTIVMHRSIPLIKYTPLVEEKKTVNLLSGDIEVKEEKNEDDEGKPKPYIQHVKPEIYCYTSPDTTVYPRNGIPDQLRNVVLVNTELNYYEPLFVCSDYWMYNELLVPLNNTVDTANVTVHFQPYSFMKLMMIGQMDTVNQMYKEWGLQQDMDLTKKMLAETNFYLLVLTMFVSLAHTVCEVMAFKNEIHFWKNRESMKGISVRTLFIHLVMSVIIFLYLLDRNEETSYMIILPAGFGILIECWKITKACKVESKDSFPWISITDKDSYHEDETDKHDKIAMKYLSYAMYPLLAIYTVYSLMYEEHKGWYSFVINTLVGAVYVFGFITMTPQLYINYKLKSVEHLPWRALIYRFLNTIIDDLFSFIISMPTMHRLSCFRDDIIFVIYLYQRWIYRVDKTRDPYGTLSKEEKAKEENKKIEAEGESEGESSSGDDIISKEGEGDQQDIRQRKK